MKCVATYETYSYQECGTQSMTKLMEAREKNKRLQSELDEMRDELEDQ